MILVARISGAAEASDLGKEMSRVCERECAIASQTTTTTAHIC